MSEQLDSLRKRIDEADRELLEALAQRMKVVNEILQEKESRGLPLFDPVRETELLTRVARLAGQRDLDAVLAERVLKEVINHSREVQSRRVHRELNPDLKQVRTVSFQGTRGAYSWLACRKHFGREIEAVGYGSFSEAVDALEEGHVDLAVLPIENVLAGSIYEVYDLLTESRLHVVGEEYFRVEHCLIGLAETPLEQIEAVFSHPVALQQCRGFIKGLPNARYETYIDSAEAVRKVKRDGDPKHAAIASAEAAELYELSVLREGISDHPENYTRFWVISREPVAVDLRIPAKTSVQLVTDHTEGALVAALAALAAQGVNLTKLESRPQKGTAWQYQFHLEMEGNVEEERVIRALDDVRSRARLLRVLGCFPSGDLATPSRAEISDRQVFPTESAGPVFVHRVETPGTDAQPARPRETKQISLGAVLLGGEEFVLIVGLGLTTPPEKIEQVARLARARGNALLLAIQEPGSRRFDLERFRQFRNVTAEYQLPIACLAQASEQVEPLSLLVDLFVISSRNMQSTSLLEEVGRVSVPVVLKRGISSTLRELLVSADTILERGNQDVVLCERGIRTFESVSRTTLDLGAIMALKDRTHLPVVVDPTQCVTQAHRIRPLVRACREVGADGAILQVDPNKSESKRYALGMEHLVEIMNGSPPGNGE